MTPGCAGIAELGGGRKFADGHPRQNRHAVKAGGRNAGHHARLVVKTMLSVEYDEIEILLGDDFDQLRARQAAPCCKIRLV